MHIKKLIIVAIITLMSAGCASTNGTTGKLEAERTRTTSRDDSLSLSVYEELFYELHAELIERIDELESEDELNPEAVEADSIVRAAEDLYLRGDLVEAVKLLEKAKKILGEG